MSASESDPPRWPSRVACTVRTDSTRIRRAISSRAGTSRPAESVETSGLTLISRLLGRFVRAGQDRWRERAQDLERLRTVGLGRVEEACRDKDRNPGLELGGPCRADEPAPARDAVDGLFLGRVDMTGRPGTGRVDRNAHRGTLRRRVPRPDVGVPGPTGEGGGLRLGSLDALELREIGRAHAGQ